MEISCTVNGSSQVLHGEPETALLYLLRGELGLLGTRFGCGHGPCGACTVLIAGRAVQSCQVPLWSLAHADITTVEGLGSDTAPHALQQAFADEQAGQCGYCLSGILMTATELLNDNPDPSEQQVRSALDRHLCRCGAHNRIVRAVLRAAAALR